MDYRLPENYGGWDLIRKVLAEDGWLYVLIGASAAAACIWSLVTLMTTFGR